MTRWKERTELEHQVVLLIRRGRSRREIARALGVSRGLVGKVLDERAAVGMAPTALPDVAGRTPRASKLDAFAPRITELIKIIRRPWSPAGKARTSSTSRAF